MFPNLGWLVMSSFLQTASPESGLRAVPFTAVRIADQFWAPRLRLVREVTLPHCFRQCEETGRLSNFDKAAGKAEGKHEGYYFNDSDVYKVIEGAAYALQHQRDAKLEEYVDNVIARIAAAQQADGYLNTYYTLNPQEQRFSDIGVKHEMYCVGHLLEAGIAYAQATGKRTLLHVAMRAVENVMSVFGPGRRTNPPGHQELELALVKLHRLTNDRRYLDQARFFIEQRGVPSGRELYGEYSQDHLPIRQQTAIVGHAVRALYFLCGVADLAAIDRDAGYDDALDRMWADTYATRLYITGGLGPSAHNEGFTTPYDLPNDSAYAETCAAIASVFWNQRMALLHADGKYADIVERSMYNGVLSGLSLSGDRFFYTNPLGSRGEHQRVPWFACACCPPNVVRFIPSVGGYAYAASDHAILVNQYIAGEADVSLAAGRVALRVATEYPWEGRVDLSLQCDKPTEFDLAVRIPEWCRRWEIRSPDGTSQNPPPQHGYVHHRRTWAAGDQLSLAFDMPPQRVVAHPSVAADRGRVALQRGPLIYCVEDADHASHARQLVLPPTSELRVEPRADLLGGVRVIRAAALDTSARGDEDGLYAYQPQWPGAELTAIPYFAWCNRGPGGMLVWIPESAALHELGSLPWVTPSASFTNGRDPLLALHDRTEPKSSADGGVRRFTWWPHKGGVEWVQYDFREPRAVCGVAVYWFDDSASGGGCSTPASWSLKVRKDGGWVDAPASAAGGVEPNRFNELRFSPVTTDGLRLEVQLQPGRSAGVLEWRPLLPPR
ncbi:MAG: hypothetical protein CHACPFDD_01620 [Phycisphaerae bacterium]|nr:hypothetical protein [Phycisphaerae bacterium]